MIRSLTVDPRLFGIVPGGYDQIHRGKLDDLKRDPLAAKVGGARLDVAGGPAARITLDYGEWRKTSFVVAGSSLLPTSMTTRVLPQLSKAEPKIDVREVLDEVESRVESMPNAQGVRFDFPRRITFRRVQDGREVLPQSIEILKADFNVPIDDALFTWKALNPQKGVRLLPDNDVSALLLWDGQALRDADPADWPKLPVDPQTD